MKKILLAAGLLAACSIGAFGQGPDGSDINKAIPIYFGQTVNDIADFKTKERVVYSITLDRGQAFTVTAKATGGGRYWDICVLSPTAATVSNLKNDWCYQHTAALKDARTQNGAALSFEYQVAAAGKYYVMVQAFSPDTPFELQVNAKGTPLLTTLPTSAGCLSGKVDSILYSLQLIAAGLPDEVTIGGQRACRACTVKPPLYPEISNRLEGALRSGVNVEACYDSAGSIFQLKLLRQ